MSPLGREPACVRGQQQGAGKMPNITFQMEKQKTVNWCWAAVAVSVNRHFAPDSHWRQCGIVEVVLSRAKGTDKLPLPVHACCTKPIPRRCNQAWYLEDALKQVGRLKGWPKAVHLSFKKIQREIDAQRPVCVRIQWREPGNPGHFVVISGYHITRTRVRQVDVEDPATGSLSTVHYRTLVSNYRHSGRWTHTYLVEEGR